MILVATMLKFRLVVQTKNPGDLLVLNEDGFRVPPESEKSSMDASKTWVLQEERLMSK